MIQVTAKVGTEKVARVKVHCVAEWAGQGVPVTAWLREAGYELIGAGDTAGLTIADAAMGLEAVAAVCRDAAGPVLAINVRDGDLAAVVEAGAADFLPPPVTRARLLARVALVEKRRQGAATGAPPPAPQDETYRAVLEGASDGIWVQDCDSTGTWRTSYVNQAYLRLTGVPADSAIGATLEELLPRDLARRAANRNKEAIRARGTIRFESEIEIDGRPLSIVSSLTPLFDADGRCHRLVCTVRDVTEQKQAEQILHASEERLHGIVEAAGDGIIVIDSRGIIESFNPAAEELFGFEAIEVLGRNVGILMPSPFSEAHDGYIARYIATGKRNAIGRKRETSGQRKDGTTFPIELSIGEMWIGTERQFTGIVRDITERKQAEERFRLLSESSTISNYVAQDGVFQYVNPQFERLTGYTSAELVGTNPLEIVEPEDRDFVREQAVMMLKGERGGEYEYRIRNRDGEIHWVMESVVSLDYRGRRATFGNYVDITERKLAEMRFATLAERSPIGIYIAQDRALQYVNPRFSDITGYSAEEVMGTSPLDLVLPEDRAMVRESAIRMLKGTDTGDYVYRIQNKAGGIRWIMENLVSIDYRGRRAAYGYYVDITDRKESEEALRESEERYRATFEHLHDVLFKTDARGIFTMISPSAKKLLGYAPEELTGNLAGTIFASPEQAAVMLENLLNGKLVEEEELTLRRKDGSEVLVELSASLIFGEGLDSIAIQGTVRDITERKRAEEALRASEELYRLTFQNLRDVFFTTDLAGIYTMVSPSCRFLHGYTAEELIGASSLDMYANPADYQRLVQAFGRRRGVDDFQFDLVRKDGSIVPVSLAAALVFDGEGQPIAVQGTARDITERRHAEEAMRESEERYRSTFENMHDVFYVTDAQGVLTMMSPSSLKQTGYRPEELVGTMSVALYSRPGDYEALVKELLEAGSVNDFETQMRLKDGTDVAASINAVILRDEQGNMTGTQGTVRDISERKRAEEERDRYFQMSVDPLAVTGLDARFQRVNPAWERVLGYTEQEMLGRTVMRFAHPDDRQQVIDSAMLTLIGQSLENHTARFVTKGGEIRWLSWNTSPVINGSGYSVVRDVTEQVRAKEEQDEMMAILEENAHVLSEQAAELDALRTEAEYAANHDMLTGLMNRRAWFNAALSNRGTAVALVDIDHFKRINDTWGHPAGDAVLMEVSRRLQESLGGAVLGRVGGEEFAILFTGAFAAARRLCEQTLAAVRAEPIALPCGEEVVITMSGGLVPWRSGHLTREHSLGVTYEEADVALYQAKQNGRNRLVAVPRLKAA